jgi:hypothetical protein
MQEFESHPGIYYPEQEWGNFINTIKHKVRYCLFDNRLSMPSNVNLKGYTNTNMIPSVLIDIILRLNLITEISINTEFYRARVHSIDKVSSINSLSELCSPPYENAKSQRISPYGISFFYCANNRETAIKEVKDQRSNTEKDLITSAKFISNKKLILLDFSLDLDERKTETTNRYSGATSPATEYLKLFIEELQKPVSHHDDKVHLEYLPTQFLLEYIRLFIFKGMYMETFSMSNKETKTEKTFLYSPYTQYETYKNIDGICYKSTKSGEGKCYCLFFSHEDFLNDNRPLRLVTESIETTSNY